MNNVENVLETAEAAGMAVDRLTVAYSIGYNLGLRVRDCWNAPYVFHLCAVCRCSRAFGRLRLAAAFHTVTALFFAVSLTSHQCCFVLCFVVQTQGCRPRDSLRIQQGISSCRRNDRRGSVLPAGPSLRLVHVVVPCRGESGQSVHWPFMVK
jgi:hypothetical protein